MGVFRTFDPLRLLTRGRFHLFPIWPETTGYRAKIAKTTTDGRTVHDFVFVTNTGWDEPAILGNPVEFVMPEDPTFVKKRKLSTKFDGSLIPVYEIVQIPEEEITNDMDRVGIPDELKGKRMPVVERSDEELSEISEGV